LDGDGSLEMNASFAPFGTLPYLAQIGVGMRLAPELKNLRWLALTDARENGLTVAAGQTPFAFSSLHFTALDLATAQHNHKLKTPPGSGFIPRRETMRLGQQ
jgi:hypothetical protein